jgi:serine/threonine protein kinase HipA of HipAB toxin-antitoxin module
MDKQEKTTKDNLAKIIKKGENPKVTELKEKFKKIWQKVNFDK